MRDALAKAREEDEGIPLSRRSILKMARVHADVADSLLDSEDNLPLFPVLTLYREAILHLLADDDARKGALAVAMAPASQSPTAAPEQEDVRVARLRHILTLQSQLSPDNSSPQEQRHIAEMTRTSVRALLQQFDKSTASHVRAVRRRRWRRIGVAAMVLLTGLASLVGLGILLFAPKDLAKGKFWHTSSALAAHYEAKMLFHTSEEMNPWFEIDLGRPNSISRLYIKNRTDCCLERAVPLLVQVSNDRSIWKQVARSDSPFKIWEPTFSPVEARYVRLTVPRISMLHFDQVKVY
jgi:hypothetical protein